jgi:hypothetical protein
VKNKQQEMNAPRDNASSVSDAMLPDQLGGNALLCAPGDQGDQGLGFR